MHCPKQVVVLSSIDSVTSKITGLLENFSFFFCEQEFPLWFPFADAAFFCSSPWSRLFMNKDVKGRQWNGKVSNRIWNYVVGLLTFLDFFFKKKK